VVATVASIPGADAWSAQGSGDNARVGVAVVHGFTGNPLSTRPLGERLNHEGYTVVVARLPGHGTNVRDMGRTRYADWRAEVERVVDDLASRCDVVVLVGLSMGGTLTLDVASSRTDAVDGAVAINAQLLDPTQALAKLAPLLQYVVPYVPRDLAGLPSDDIAKPGEDEHAYGWIPARSAQSLTTQLRRIRGQLLDLRQPILVAYSPQDHTVPADSSRALVDLVGSDDVTELVLEHSFHVATLDHDRELLEDAVVAFVGKVAAR